MLKLVGQNLFKPLPFFQPDGSIILIHPYKGVVHPSGKAIHDFIFCRENNINPWNRIQIHLCQQCGANMFRNNGPLFSDFFNPLVIMNIKMFGRNSLPLEFGVDTPRKHIGVLGG